MILLQNLARKELRLRGEHNKHVVSSNKWDCLPIDYYGFPRSMERLSQALLSLRQLPHRQRDSDTINSVAIK